MLRPTALAARPDLRQLVIGLFTKWLAPKRGQPCPRPASGSQKLADKAVQAPSVAAWHSCVLSILSFVPLLGAAADASAAIGLPTTETALLGRFTRGPVALPVKVGAVEFDALFSSADHAAWPAEVQGRQFFANGGGSLYVVRIAETGLLADALAGSASGLSGIHALEPISDLRLLIAPELSLLPAGAFGDTFSRFRAFLEPRRIFFILDPPPGLVDVSAAVDWVQSFVPADAQFCAIYYPYLKVVLDGAPFTVGACGAMAAIYAKSDAAVGIWHSPAGTSLPIQAQALYPVLGTSDSDLLNASNVNPIREFPGTGIVPFGARSLDRSNADNRFIVAVRTRGWIAASLERSLAFAAVADNGEPLWSQIRAMVENFLSSLFRQGGLVGRTSEEAYFVRCDATTTMPADMAAYRVKALYGLALLRPNEFDITILSAPAYDVARPVKRPAINVRAVTGNLVLAYPTVAGFSYALEVSATLQPGAWTAGGPSMEGDGAWRRPVIPMTAGHAAYRLRITPGR